MGTANFSIYGYGRSGMRAGSGAVASSTVINSGSFTTSTTAANLEDAGATDITLAVGQVIGIILDEAGWVNFGGNTAVNGTGHPLPANVLREFECDVSGTVSIKDTA